MQMFNFLILVGPHATCTQQSTSFPHRRNAPFPTGDGSWCSLPCTFIYLLMSLTRPHCHFSLISFSNNAQMANKYCPFECMRTYMQNKWATSNWSSHAANQAHLPLNEYGMLDVDTLIVGNWFLQNPILCHYHDYGCFIDAA